MDVDARLEVLAGVVIQDDRRIERRLAGAAQRVDERTGQGDHAAEARELLIRRALEGRLAEQRVFRRRRGEERVAHLVEQHVAARVAVLKRQREILGQAVLEHAREHGEVVGLAGARSADERDDAVRALEVAGGQLTAAVRAGDVGAGQTHRVEGEPLVVEACGLESQARVGAQDRIATQVLMDRDAQRVAGVEARPADRAYVRAAVLFGREESRVLRTDLGFFRRGEERSDLREVEADLEADGRAGEGFGRQAGAGGRGEEFRRRMLAELIAGAGVEEHPEVGPDEGEILLRAGGHDEQGGGKLDGRRFGDRESLAQRCAIDQGHTGAGGLESDGLARRDEGQGRVGSVAREGGRQLGGGSFFAAEAIDPGEGGGVLAGREHRLLKSGC